MGLRGRTIVAPHGVNGTLGGDVVELKKYVCATKEYRSFRDIDVKWSEGRPPLEDGSTADFPRLVVKVRPEVVTFGQPDAVRLDGHAVADGGTHLDPQQLHDLVVREDVVFFDGRNRIESAIGRFSGAVVPSVDTTREFVELLDKRRVRPPQGQAGGHLLHRWHPLRDPDAADARARVQRGLPARRRRRHVRCAACATADSGCADHRAA